MRAHLTKATGLHIADRVWEGADRFLFPDKSGRRLGKPHPGKWTGFTTVPGRARSHTKAVPTWETCRLAGTLQGHLDAHGTTPGLTVAEAAALQPGRAVLAQPGRLRAPGKPRKWSAHTGALTVIYTGLPGGWRYYAHLTVLGPGYASPATRQIRASVPAERLAGVDGNVSNIAVASLPAPGTSGPVLTSRVTITPDQKAVARREAVKARRRQRHLDRSRRAANPGQYSGSRGQEARAERRAAAGLREHARRLVTAGRITDFPLTGEQTAQQEGPSVRSTIRHNPAAGTGGDGSHPVVASAGQGERPAQPRNRNHGHPWGQRRKGRTSHTPGDPQAASRLRNQLS